MYMHQSSSRLIKSDRTTESIKIKGFSDICPGAKFESLVPAMLRFLVV